MLRKYLHTDTYTDRQGEGKETTTALSHGHEKGSAALLCLWCDSPVLHACNLSVCAAPVVLLRHAAAVPLGGVLGCRKPAADLACVHAGCRAVMHLLLLLHQHKPLQGSPCEDEQAAAHCCPGHCVCKQAVCPASPAAEALAQPTTVNCLGQLIHLDGLHGCVGHSSLPRASVAHIAVTDSCFALCAGCCA